MKIPFETIEETITEKMRGGEGFLGSRRYIDGDNKIMMARLEPGCTVGLHTHDTDSEVIYILSGSAKALYDGQTEHLSVGDCHYCPKGHEHSLINDGTDTLRFLAIVGNHGA